MSALQPSDRGPGLLLGDGVRIGADVRFGAYVVVHAGTAIGDGCEIQDGAILGKPPKLARHSAAAGRAVPPLALGAGTVVCARAIVFAGAEIGAGAILGDQSFVRERARIGDGTVIGRGSAVDNDVVIGARVRVQTDVYLTAFSVVEDDVFVGPGVCTTNDDTMSRHGPEYALRGALAAARLPDRRRGGAVPGRRGRRGGVRRGRGGRDARRAGAHRRDGRAGARGARGARGGTRRALAIAFRRMSDEPRDPGLTSGDPLAPGPEAPRHDSGLPGWQPSPSPPAEGFEGGYTSPPPPGAFGAPAGPVGAASRSTLAGWWSRVGAALIDGIIISIGAVLILAIFGSVFSVGFFASDEAGIVSFFVGMFLAAISISIVALIYAPVFMARTNGQTLGRMAVGIRVVRNHGEPMTFGFALLREVVVKALLFGIVSAFTFGLASLADVLWPLFDDENRALHDFIVDTRVVRA